MAVAPRYWAVTVAVTDEELSGPVRLFNACPDASVTGAPDARLPAVVVKRIGAPATGPLGPFTVATMA